MLQKSGLPTYQLVQDFWTINTMKPQPRQIIKKQMPIKLFPSEDFPYLEVHPSS